MCEQGETPLHLAAFKGHEPVLKILLDSKADIQATTHRVRIFLPHPPEYIIENQQATIRQSSTLSLKHPGFHLVG